VPAAARRSLPAIDPQGHSAELQRLSEAVGRASQLFGEVDQAFQRVATGQEHPGRKALWRLAAEFRKSVDEVRGHAAAIHEEERRRNEVRWASVQKVLDHEPACRDSPDREDEANTFEVNRELGAAVATAEDRFKAAQHAFVELRAAHAAGQPGDLEGWRQSVADFRTAMVDVHRLTSALRHPNQPGA
jgi:hypothetical protein